MSPRVIYPIIGLVIGAGVDLLINLLAAAIQQRVFADQFGSQSIWLLLGLVVVGLLVGYWLGVSKEPPKVPPSRPGIETTKLKARRGSIEVVTQTGKDIKADEVEAGQNISIRDEQVQPDTDPKADPPA